MLYANRTSTANIDIYTSSSPLIALQKSLVWQINRNQHADGSRRAHFRVRLEATGLAPVHGGSSTDLVDVTHLNAGEVGNNKRRGINMCVEMILFELEEAMFIAAEADCDGRVLDYRHGMKKWERRVVRICVLTYLGINVSGSHIYSLFASLTVNPHPILFFLQTFETPLGPPPL